MQYRYVIFCIDKGHLKGRLAAFSSNVKPLNKLLIKFRSFRVGIFIFQGY